MQLRSCHISSVKGNDDATSVKDLGFSPQLPKC